MGGGGGGSGGGAGGNSSIGDGIGGYGTSNGGGLGGLAAAAAGMGSVSGDGMAGDGGGDSQPAPQPRQPGAPPSGTLLAPAVVPDTLLRARKRAGTASSQGGDGQIVSKTLLGQ